MNVVGVGIEQFGFYLTLVLALLFCLVYLAVGLRVLREDSMGNKVAQFYGYSVCLVAIISTMVSIGSLAGALMEWGDPLHASDYSGYPARSLASFETYKMDSLNPPYGGPQSSGPRYTPDDETFRRMYDAARADRIQSVRARVRRTIVTNGLIVLFSAVLFGIHWRWLRRESALK